jgi:hypothetical protein
MDLDIVESGIGFWSLSFVCPDFDPVFICHTGDTPPTAECFGVALQGFDASEAIIDKVDFGFSAGCGDLSTNGSRARAAAVALVLFNRFFPNGSHDEVFVDLLTDLQHLSDSLGIDFSQAIDSANSHYMDEIDASLTG